MDILLMLHSQLRNRIWEFAVVQDEPVLMAETPRYIHSLSVYNSYYSGDHSKNFKIASDGVLALLGPASKRKQTSRQKACPLRCLTELALTRALSLRTDTDETACIFRENR